MGIEAKTRFASVFNPNTVLFFVIAALGVIVYWGGLSNAFERWGEQPEYSHGYLIPLVSLYILWERKPELMVFTSSSSWWGAVACFLAMLVLIVGEISALYLLIHYSFLLFLLGVSLVTLGAGTRFTWVPIAILGFAIPLPYIIEVLLTAKMQLISSSLGVQMIRWFDIPVYLSGNIIDLGEFQLHVVEACSGLRYLFPLACLGFIAAYFYQAVWWKRALVFLSTVPITILMNSARIGLTGVLVENYGTRVAQGFLHDFEGWVVFLVCMVILVAEIIAIERLTTGRKLGEVFRLSPAKPFEQKINQSSGVPQKACVVVLLLVSMATLNVFERDTEQQLDSRSLATFPMRLDTWQGTRDILAQDVLDNLQLSDYLVANYFQREALVNFYVAYYDSQRKGVSPHSPKVCIPGGGWEITEFKRVQFNGMPVNRVIIRKGNQSQLVYYWFVERGEVVANEYVKKWMLFRDAITENRTDGALVRVVTPIEAKESIGDAEARASRFIATAQPKLLAYLPGKPNQHETRSL